MCGVSISVSILFNRHLYVNDAFNQANSGKEDGSGEGDGSMVLEKSDDKNNTG